MRTLICLPTYNEVDNLWPAIDRVLRTGCDVEVLVIDDGSPDGTGEVADAIAEDDPQVHVLHRADKEGLGRAYLAGFAWAERNGYDLVVEMDADGSHRAEDLPRLLEAADRGADLVLGSRWMSGGRVERWPLHRLLLSRGGNAYARTLLGLPYRDVTGGYRALRLDRLPLLEPGSVQSAGYCFQVDVVRRAHAAGLTVVEVPIVFVDRERGESKMSSAIVLEALGSVTRWGVQRLLRRLRGGVGGEGARARIG